MWSGTVNRPDRRLTGRKIRNVVYDIFPFHKMIRAGALVAVNHSRTPPAYWLMLALCDSYAGGSALRSAAAPVNGGAILRRRDRTNRPLRVAYNPAAVDSRQNGRCVAPSYSKKNVSRDSVRPGPDDGKCHRRPARGAGRPVTTSGKGW